MATRLSVTNLLTGPLAVLGMGTIAASGTKAREYSQVELDPMLAQLDVAAAAGWLRYHMSPGARAVRSYVAVAGGTSPDVLTWDHRDILSVDTTADSATVTLPPAATCPGRILWLKRPAAANVLLLDPAGTEQLDGAGAGVATTIPAAAGQAFACYSTGTAWVSLHNEVAP